MIIACKQCQTRFKVPDGKVTARGRKVRCSRCGHTFRIYPDSAAEPGADPAPAAVRPRTPDPFQAFGPEGTSDLEKTPARGTTVSELLAQMAPAAQSDDFDVDVAGESPGTEPAWNFPPAPSREEVAEALAEPPPSPVVPPAVAAIPVRPVPEPPSMDMGPLPVWPLPSAITAGHDPDLSDPFDASPYPAGEVPPPDPVPAPASAVDPHLATLAGFTPAWGVAAPVRALSVDGTLSSHAPSLSPAIEPEAPPPEPQFGGAGTVLDDLPALEPAPPLPSDGLELDRGNAARDWTGAAPGGNGGAQIELEPDLASMDLDVGLPPAPAPVPGAGPDWSFPPPAIPPVAPAAASPGVAWDDPFAAPPSAPVFSEPVTPPPRAAPADMSVMLDEAPSGGPVGPEHGLFEMPGPGLAETPALSLLPDIPDAAEFGAAGATAPPGLAAPVPAISKPPSRARLGLQERELPGTARRVSGVVLNMGLAALLLVVVAGLASSWVSAGRLEGSALSPRRLLQALRPGSGVSPVEIVPGTYETQSGRSLLYVRGRVLNRGAPAGRVRVRAEVWDGAQAVKAGETLAGAIATPEQLWRAATPADVERLRASLLAAAKPVGDGQGADFLVLLDDAPRDLAGLRLQITATIER